jgi:hypothetical protein
MPSTNRDRAFVKNTGFSRVREVARWRFLLPDLYRGRFSLPRYFLTFDHETSFNQYGAAMEDVTPERTATQIDLSGLASYFKVLTFATGLLLAWAGLCRI